MCVDCRPLEVTRARAKKSMHGLNCGFGPISGVGAAPHELVDTQAICFYELIVGCPVAAILAHHQIEKNSFPAFPAQQGVASSLA